MRAIQATPPSPVPSVANSDQTWHQLEVNAVLAKLETDQTYGLDETVAAERLERDGPNALIEAGVKSPWLILLEQFTGTMVLVLILAAVVSIVLGEVTDAIAILVIVVLNAALGFSQEFRAEQAMAALRQLSSPTVRLRRGGKLHEHPAGDLVAGDIVLLEAGNLVSADGRLLEAVNLRIQESSLTGESVPVDKSVPALESEVLPVGDRANMVFMGTAVTAGRGLMVVTETGMRSELGRLAGMSQSVKTEATPLQRRLAKLGRDLAFAALALVAVVFVLGVLRGEDAKLMLITALSLAVAVVPEGLPAVATITLALGAQRMLKRRALIRKLAAVETLGSVTVICSDKTGTMTQNRMTVSVLDVAGNTLEFEELLERSGTAIREQPETQISRPELIALIAGAVLCNDANLVRDDQNNPEAAGDPTETALVVAAAHVGLVKPTLEERFPRVSELAFDSERKCMTTVHRVPTELPNEWPLGASTHVAFTKGAPGGLLEVCTRVLINGEVQRLDEAQRERINAAQRGLASRQMRVLGVAYRPLDTIPNDTELERDLTFIGVIGMIDPLRPEVLEAVATCKTAGIRTVMITGDHPLTAQQIARELGIGENSQVLTGRELEGMTPEELATRVPSVSVFARVAPEHKLRIIEALQSRGELVSMTGDGVNDAPALKRADIGVAMGMTGTDVAKQASAMVLLDDNFATIVSAVKEGRVIFDNIRKFVKYTMTSNAGEIWTMLLGPLLGMPLALVPLQILWINLVTDGLPGLALGFEPAERGTMQRPPYPLKQSFFDQGLGWHILWVGLLMGGVSLGTGYVYWRAGSAAWQTMVFTTLTLSQMGHVLAIRSSTDSLFGQGLGSNKPLVAAVALTFALQLAVIYLPPLQSVFRTRALSLTDLGIALGLSTVVFIAVEIEKLIRRFHQGGQSRLV
jgi:P-type Ca2+ transporter type 2C